MGSRPMDPKTYNALFGYKTQQEQLGRIESLLGQQQEILSRQQAEGATAYDIRRTETNIQKLGKKLAAQQGKLNTAENTPILQQVAEKTRSRLPQEPTTVEDSRNNVLDISQEAGKIETEGNVAASVENTGADIDHVKCRNEKLEGQTHPVTGVPFARRQTEINGKKIEVVAPEFGSAYEARLPDNMLTESNYGQFKECNRQLRDAVANDPELRAQFAEAQLAEIEKLKTPTGYTWHHDIEEGVMQLVDQEEHKKTGHTGGRHLWGGDDGNT